MWLNLWLKKNTLTKYRKQNHLGATKRAPAPPTGAGDPIWEVRIWKHMTSPGLEPATSCFRLFSAAAVAAAAAASSLSRRRHIIGLCLKESDEFELEKSPPPIL